MKSYYVSLKWSEEVRSDLCGVRTCPCEASTMRVEATSAECAVDMVLTRFNIARKALTAIHVAEM